LVAALPHLRFLMCEDTKATDEGFVALSRRARVLTTAGVAALARLPRLKRVTVSGMAGVGEDITRAFPSSVEVVYASRS
jgi:hypothetical protein